MPDGVIFKQRWHIYIMPPLFRKPHDDDLKPPPTLPSQEPPFISVCMQCGRYLQKTGGMTPEGLPEQLIGAVVPNHNKRPNTSHGLCYNCYQDMMAEIEPPVRAAEWTFRQWLMIHEE